MRIAIAALHGEQSGFSMHRAGEGFFFIQRGDEMLEQYDFANRLGADAIEGVEWVPTVRLMGASSGPILHEYLDPLLEETIEAFRQAGPVDGVYLELHGAVHVDDRDRIEEEYVRRIREVVGPDAVISASMDTHGNLSRELAGLLDLAAAHRHAPHIDNLVTRDRAVTNLIATLRSGRRPTRAFVRIPVLHPGERTSTVVEPGASVFGGLLPAIERHGVLDAGLWVGFAWADEDRNAAAAYVTGLDADAVAACAEEIAGRYWDARADFVIVMDHSGSWEDALDFVAEGAARPVFVSDAGDNGRAGGSADVTVALAATRGDDRMRGVRSIFAGIVDRPAFEAAVDAGVGAVLDRAIGAAVDDRYADPVPGQWKVEGFVEGLFGEGLTGAVVRDGDTTVVLQKQIAPFVGPGDPSSPLFPWYGAIHLDVSGYDLVVVKNGYQFPSQLAVAGSSFMALTPGGTDLVVERLQFTKVERPVFPLDTDFDADLTPVVLTPGER